MDPTERSMPYGTDHVLCGAPVPCAEQKLKVEVCEVINLYMEK
jgi:hypothetical protein